MFSRKNTSLMSHDEFVRHLRNDNRWSAVIAGGVVGSVGGIVAMLLVAMAIAIYLDSSQILPLMREFLHGDIPFYIWGTYSLIGLGAGALFGLAKALKEEDERY